MPTHRLLPPPPDRAPPPLLERDAPIEFDLDEDEWFEVDGLAEAEDPFD